MTLSDPQTPVSPQTPDDSQATGISPFPPTPPSPDENVPEDIRTPWGAGELLLLLGLAIGSLFVMAIVLELFLIARFHMTSDQLTDLLKTSAPLNVGFQAIWSGLIFLFLFLTIRVYHGRPFWSSLRWRLLRPRTLRPAAPYLVCICGGIALAIANSIVSSFVGEKNGLPIEQLFGTRTNVIWLMVFGIGVAPFFEETIFRGYLYPVFARKWGIPAGIVITGLLFGFVHAAQLWGAWAQISLIVLVGIALTYARARTGSVLASYLIHVSYNSFLFAAFFVSTHGLKHIPPVH